MYCKTLFPPGQDEGGGVYILYLIVKMVAVAIIGGYNMGER
jgi:hypothetical protein